MVYSQEMELIDPCFKRFKFNFDVKPSGIILLSGVVQEMIKYYKLKDEVYLHLNYVSKNIFLYRLFSLEGIEMNYTRDVASSFDIRNIPTNSANDHDDLSLVKTLSYYDVVGSFLVFVCRLFFNCFVIYFLCHIVMFVK